MPSIAEQLNRECACVSVDREALKTLLDRGEGMGGIYDSILAKQPHLFASVPVFLGRSHLAAMVSLIDAIEGVIALPAFRDRVLPAAPPLARLAPGPLGVFYGYDFHLGADGPQLIEVNTNAGGPLVNAVLAQAQKACCQEMKTLSSEPVPLESLPEAFVAMFRNEWTLQRGAAPLRTIAIVDESPDTQYLYPEFLLFQELFRGAGVEAIIVAPEDLAFDGRVLRRGERAIDLVYNRLTDFYLQGEAARALRLSWSVGP